MVSEVWMLPRRTLWKCAGLKPSVKLGISDLRKLQSKGAQGICKIFANALKRGKAVCDRIITISHINTPIHFNLRAFHTNLHRLDKLLCPCLRISSSLYIYIYISLSRLNTHSHTNTFQNLILSLIVKPSLKKQAFEVLSVMVLI